MLTGMRVWLENIGLRKKMDDDRAQRYGRLFISAVAAMTLVAIHLGVSAVLSAVASSNFLEGLHNGKGLWNFAMDSFRYHEWAIELIEYLSDGRYSEWWE